LTTSAQERLGISLASLAPKGAFNLKWAEQAAKEAGYAFWQVLPFRGIFDKWGIMKKLVLPVKYFEQAWNPAKNLLQVISGRVRQDPKTPKLEDWLFFPNWRSYGQLDVMGATEIVHNLNKWTFVQEDNNPIGVHRLVPQLLEPSPGLWMTPEEILDKVVSKRITPCLALDTYHLRRLPRPDEMVNRPEGSYSFPHSQLGEWRKTLPKLLPHAAVIHVAPERINKKELKMFLAGEYTELREMLERIKEAGFPGDYVVEATIGLAGFNSKKVADVMTRFHDRVLELI
jgi:hypothetical protein